MQKLLLILLIFWTTIFSNELPDLGSSFDSLINTADEKKIKFQILQQVYSSNSVIQDAEINDYLNNLGNQLITSGTDEQPNVNFFIINDNSINAFAMLGNIIGVHTGLLFAANTESELASVLSHEIAHLTQKHLLRLFDSQAKNSYKSYLALAIAILAARSNPQLASGAISVASASQIQDTLDYTRSNEQEADRIGLEILNRSGYDPKGFIDFFSTMQRFNNFSTGAAPAFLRTHPITNDRISEIQDRLTNYKYIQKKNKLEFYLIKAKLKSIVGNYSDISDIFYNEIKMKSFINEPATYYGLVYSLLRQNKIIEARETFDILNKMEIESPMIYELEASLLIKENKFEKAFKLYKAGLNKYSYYRAFIYGISNLILNSGNSDKTIDFLKNYKESFQKDPIFYRLLAKAYNQKGNQLLEFENLSNAYYYQYDIQNAITLMDMAVKTNSDSFFDQSRVEHRLKELLRESELMNNS